MIANNVVTTHNGTGGTGDLTLTAIASGQFQQSAVFSDVWGTGTPDPWVEYVIRQYSDSTLMTEVQAEWGCCPLHSGNVLKRTGSGAQLRGTYVYPSTVLPSANSVSSPTALNFTNTAANVRVFCSRAADGFYQEPGFFNSTNAGTGTLADLVGRPSGHCAILTTNMGLSTFNGTLFYMPYLATDFALISKISIYMLVAGPALTKGRAALYADDGTGWAGNMVVDSMATGGTEFDMTSTGVKTSTITTPVLITPGYYVAAFQCSVPSGSPAINPHHTPLINQMGTIQARNIHAGRVAGTYGTLASTGVAASGFAFFAQASSAPEVIFG